MMAGTISMKMPCSGMGAADMFVQPASFADNASSQFCLYQTSSSKCYSAASTA